MTASWEKVFLGRHAQMFWPALITKTPLASIFIPQTNLGGCIIIALKYITFGKPPGIQEYGGPLVSVAAISIYIHTALGEGFHKRSY